MVRESRSVDYELDEVLEVREPEQFKAVGDPVRSRIISLLSERAATTSQLAEALGRSKGNVGHHLKVLEEAGLIRVVRTRRVRAITEKYYGRTARLFVFHDVTADDPDEKFQFLRTAMEEYDEPEDPAVFSGGSTLRHARIPAARAGEFNRRLMELSQEFFDQESVLGERVYGFLGAVYPTDLPELPEDVEE